MDHIEKLLSRPISSIQNFEVTSQSQSKKRKEEKKVNYEDLFLLYERFFFEKLMLDKVLYNLYSLDVYVF